MSTDCQVRMVVDSNALVFAVLADPALAFLAGHDLVAPDLARSEAMSALHEARWRGQLQPEVALAARNGLLDARIELARGRRLYTEAWDVAERFGLAKTYDAMYVALARRHDIPLLTEDRRLRRTVGDYVRTLGFAEL